MRVTPHLQHPSPAESKTSTKSSTTGEPVTTGGEPCACRRRWLITGAVLGELLLSLVLVGTAHAETTHVLAIAKSIDEVINNIRNWLVGVLAGLATVFMTVGGVRYLVAGGDPGEVEKAKTAFKSAGWGYGLAALAPLVVEILRGIVGA
jgi:Type IV secretion system pilin